MQPDRPLWAVLDFNSSRVLPQPNQLTFLIAVLNMNSGCLLFKPKFALRFYTNNFSTIIEVNQCLKQGRTNPGRQVARANKFWYRGT
jgi:hypothetical protein